MKNSKLLTMTLMVMILLGAGVTGSIVWGLLQPRILSDGWTLDVSLALNGNSTERSCRLSIGLQVESPPSRRTLDGSSLYRGESAGVEAMLETGSDDSLPAFGFRLQADPVGSSWTGILRGGQGQ